MVFCLELIAFQHCIFIQLAIIPLGLKHISKVPSVGEIYRPYFRTLPYYATTLNFLSRKTSFLFFIFASSLLLMGLLVSSCSKNKISACPQILEIKTPSEHGNGLHAIANTTNRFYIKVSDDIALTQVQLKLSKKDEFHSHVIHGGGLIPAFKAPNTGTWDVTKTTGINGMDTTVIFKLNAPNTVSGAWDIDVMVIDLDGNLSTKKETVVIQNDSIPAIIPVSTWPVANAQGIVEINAGENFTMEGNILDQNYIETVSAIVYKDEIKLWENIWSPTDVWMFDMAQIELPTFNQIGNYKLIINATDRNAWHNWVQADIVVK